MGLDTFPLLEDQTLLITYSSNVYKLKLQYEETSQEKKEMFVQVVSERAAHCQIEDVCRAVLYSIEREEKLSPIQTDNFIIYPKVSEWPPGKKFLFIVDGKPLSCYKDLISLRLTCKDVAVPEKDQVAALPSGKRKLLSFKLLHGMSQMRATTNRQTPKTASTLSPNTDESNPHTTVTCVNNDAAAAITNTPLPGISNSRGGQSPESSNKITTIIQKHSSNTELPTTNNEMSLARLSRNKPTQDTMSAESHKNILPYEYKKKRKLIIQERMEYVRKFQEKKRPKLVNLMNTDNDESKASNCGTSQNNGTQYKGKQINTNLRSLVQRAGKAINNTAQKDIEMQLVTQLNEASNDGSKVRPPDSDDGDLTESSSCSRDQSNNGTLCSSKQSGGENILNKEKLPLKSVTIPHERQNVNSAFMPLEIISSEKHSRLHTRENLLRITKTPSQEVIMEKHQEHMDEIQQHSNSLEISGTNVVEISDDGSIVNESETMSYTNESVGSVTRTGTAKHQIWNRKNTSSMKSSECDMDSQQECISRVSAQELDTLRTLERTSNLDQTTHQNNIRDDSTPTKRQTRSSKAQMHASSSNFRSVKSPNKGQTRNHNRGSSSTNEISQISSSRAAIPHHEHRHTDLNSSTTKTASGRINSSERRSRLRQDIGKSIGYYSKISSHSLRSAKECIIQKDSRALQSSKKMKIQKKMATDFNDGRTQSSDIINTSLNSYKRYAKDSSLRPSPQKSECSSRTVQSRKSSLSSCSGLSSSGAITSYRTNRTFLHASQRLLKSKDGVWLFLKT